MTFTPVILHHKTNLLKSNSRNRSSSKSQMAISSSREADTRPELFNIMFFASYCSFHIFSRCNTHSQSCRVIQWIFLLPFFVPRVLLLPQYIFCSSPSMMCGVLCIPCIRFSLCLPPSISDVFPLRVFLVKISPLVLPSPETARPRHRRRRWSERSWLISRYSAAERRFHRLLIFFSCAFPYFCLLTLIYLWAVVSRPYKTFP